MEESSSSRASYARDAGAKPAPATMADLVAKLNTLMDDATDAVANGDYPTAIQKAIAAQGLIAALPKVERGGNRATGSRSAEWTPEGIDQFIVNLRKQYNSTVGIQVRNIAYRLPGVPENY
jgi:hypothetical protein